MPYHHCTSSDRDNLQLFRAEGKSINEIAELLHKHASTLYRELCRNHSQGDYISGKAHAMVQTRRMVTKPCPKRENKETMKLVHKRLVDKESPEQISERLSLDFPHDPNKQVSTETIYQHAYDSIRKGEPPRVYRRPKSMKGYGHGKAKQVFTRGAGACHQAGG